HFTTPLLSQLHYPPSPKPYTLSLHDALPIFTHRAANPCLSIFERLRNPAEHQHLCADLDGELDDIARSSAFEDVDRFPHFDGIRSEEHTSELQSLAYLVCRLLLEKKYETICN